MEIWHRFVNSYLQLLLISEFIIALISAKTTADNSSDFNPYSPLIRCDLLPSEFVNCVEPNFVDTATYNLTEFDCPDEDEKKYRYEEVTRVAVHCHVIDDSIECAGNRTFLKEGYPCVKYTGYCFITILLQSVFLGCLGVDRFSLGHTGAAVGKLLTLGGVGVWWFVDVILILTGNLGPTDNSNWCIYY